MAYEPQVWEDGEEGGTPITAERLNHIEEGIAQIELTPGSPGDDGFPTEAQWAELVQRVEDQADQISALQDEVGALSAGNDTGAGDTEG